MFGFDLSRDNLPVMAADTHHSFRIAISVPRRGPGTRVHAATLRPRTAVVLTRPAALGLDLKSVGCGLAKR